MTKKNKKFWNLNNFPWGGQSKETDIFLAVKEINYIRTLIVCATGFQKFWYEATA